jgi:4-amino-4-deoxy-L-arabinose transferase-like glycosyltransferase
MYYPVAMLVGFFPWSVFALPLAIDTALQLRRRERFHPGYLLAACWIGVFVIVFSLVRTKLPSYIAPCYPALALLAGDYVDRWTRQAAAVAGGWLWAAFGCLTLAGIAITIGVPLAAQHYVPGEEWLGLIGLTPLAGGAACLGLVMARNFRAAAGVFAAASVTLLTLIFALGAQRVDQHQMSHVLLTGIRANSHHPTVASYSILEPSWVFYLGQPIVELRSSPQASAKQQLAAFLAQQPEGFVITTRSRLDDILRFVPHDVGVVAEAPLFLKRGSLVVLGRRSAPVQQIGTSSPNSQRNIGLR